LIHRAKSPEWGLAVCFLLATLLVSPVGFAHVVLLEPAALAGQSYQTALLDVIESSASGHQH
jgi:hypothetical protein